MTRANTPQRAPKGVLASFSSLPGDSPPADCSLAIPSFGALWGPKEFYGSGGRSWQGGRRSLTGVRRGDLTQSGDGPAPQNRVCPCQSKLTIWQKKQWLFLMDMRRWNAAAFSAAASAWAWSYWACWYSLFMVRASTSWVPALSQMKVGLQPRRATAAIRGAGSGPKPPLSEKVR